MRWQDDLEKFKARLQRGEDVFGECHLQCPCNAPGQYSRRAGPLAFQCFTTSTCSRCVHFLFPGPLIRKYLLDNGHRVTVELRPDASLGDAIEADEQKRLAAAREAMGSADLDAVVAATKASVPRAHCNLGDVHTAECPGCLGNFNQHGADACLSHLRSLCRS